jgi:hypothetical protein
MPHGLPLASRFVAFHSEEKHMDKIASALVKAQKGFAPALKSSSNPHFKSKYADLAACVEAVVDSLNANGIALIQKQHPSEGGVCVETVFVHESGEVFSAGLLTVPASKQDPQGYGSALTYARRYSLMAACGIAPEDDDGNAASKTPPAKFAHQKGNERAATAAQRVAAEIIEAIRADMTLRVVEKYQAACDDSNEFADQVWDRLAPPERQYITAALNAAQVAA